MSRHLVFALSIAVATAAQAQERLSTVRIATEPNGLRFFVDEQPYRGTQAFSWPTGSKHTLRIDPLQFPFEGQRASFTGWSDATGTLNTAAEAITVTADPSVTSFKAMFELGYRLRILFYSCPDLRQVSCQPPGSVLVDGTRYTTDVDTYVSPGGTVGLVAQPSAGFVFAGWGQPGGYNTSFVYRHVMREPATFMGIFAAAKRVTLRSDPPELLVAPDATPTATPVTMEWGEGTRHTLGVVSPQSRPDNADSLWVFSHWSNGGKENESYVAREANVPDALTAKFVPGVRTSFVTEPVGLRLRVQGRENWPAYNFVWGVGMKYQISAAAEQTDSRGRLYKFKGWSNGGPAAQEITLTEEHVRTGFRLIAVYEPLSRLTIETSPAGVPLTVDGVECRGACTFDRAPGTKLSIRAPMSVSLSDTSRMDFAGWADGGEPERVVTLTQEASTRLTAHYRNLYKLVLNAEPGDGALFRTEPASADGFYEKETSISLTAQAKPGYRFRRWEGDLSGTFRTGQLQMTAPRYVRALFDIAPWVDEAGARNAAGDNGEALVAPGSIAMLLGANLAAGYEAGPANPLSQSIGSVTLRLRDRLMPLVFVSPGQVNFQVPSDLADGEYPLTVRWGSLPEVSTRLTVARNAPGLFHKKLDGIALANGMREDGSVLEAGTPVKRGELVTLFGTGFGPFDKPTLDGFAIPGGIPYNLVDPVELLSGDRVITLEAAAGVAGQVGMNMIRFRVPADLDAPDGVAPFRVRVNGRESNTELLRLE
jgi:uncharacterized protein (TIGR03437 family)